ncbi:hypothetical protein UY3_07204 [Chelonia mydas]|uniref:Uncharacterized protein n=1 Tax=Chelonia mydas TaxID=8469 RepID=M7BCA2_CHEMY|nr:hypothetical protein UY3_07204 [Chelonia mydas]
MGELPWSTCRREDGQVNCCHSPVNSAYTSHSSGVPELMGEGLIYRVFARRDKSTEWINRSGGKCRYAMKEL